MLRKREREYRNTGIQEYRNTGIQCKILANRQCKRVLLTSLAILGGILGEGVPPSSPAKA